MKSAEVVRDEIVSQGLLSLADGAIEDHRYNPSSDELDHTAGQLVNAYATETFRMIEGTSDE